MRLLRSVTCLTAILLAGGEIARWWGDPRIVPMAFDELAVAAVLLAAAAMAGRRGAAPLIAAWALFCGLMLGLIVPTIDHFLYGPPKASAAFYAVVLAAMLALGLWATLRALTLIRERPTGR